MNPRTTFGAALGMADQLSEVLAVMREFGADEDRAEQDPAGVLRTMLQTWKTLADRATATPARPPSPAHFDSGATPTLAQLVPGVTVRRYTEHDRDYAHTEVPCCDRPVRLPLDPGLAPHLYGCRFCAKAYTAEVLDEHDGGYAALFTVRPETFVVIGNHKRRKADR